MTALDAALKWPWLVEQGEDTTLFVPVLDGDGQPVNVSGWSVDAKVKDRPGGSVLYSFPSEGAVPDGVRVKLTVPGAASSAFTFSRAWYRVLLTDPDGGPLWLVQGLFAVTPS